MATMLPAEARARAAATWLTTDRGARRAFLAAIVVALAVWYVVGRQQWFIRDDWMLLITRENMQRDSGWQRALFQPGAGHWLTVPVLVYRMLRNVFGLDSYWPFLGLNLLLHLGLVLAVRQLIRRVGVTEWTNTLVCAMLLVFGAGWENIVFAVQITCNASLLVFFVQILLTDHEGDVDRRDFAGAAFAIVGVMSSGFGPFFCIGIAIFLGLRRRWKALAVAVVPQGLLLAWWAVKWGGQSSEPRVGGPVSEVGTFALHGMLAVFDSLTGTVGIAGIAAVATVGVTLWRRPGWRSQTILITLFVTTVGTYVGVGYERIGFGVEGGAISRYQHIGAMLLAPGFAVAVDRLRRFAPEALWAGRLVLVASIVINAGALHINGSAWKIRARDEQRVLELVAGSPLTATVDSDIRPLPFSPDVSIASLPSLIADGAFVPRVPTTPEEIATVRAALGLPPESP
ncbi:MAG: hypothetical protein JWN99_1487 [Ilumatobacteraceae bacterium]|nr:hypothetical protein [Ilumatobacteraceae bacterium]